MKLFNLFRKKEKIEESGSFSDFFLHASKEKQMRVFTEAARRANEDQRALVEQYNQMNHKTT